MDYATADVYLLPFLYDGNNRLSAVAVQRACRYVFTAAAVPRCTGLWFTLVCYCQRLVIANNTQHYGPGYLAFGLCRELLAAERRLILALHYYIPVQPTRLLYEPRWFD